MQAATLLTGHPQRIFIGREGELSRLQSCLAEVLRGERQLCFIRGEPGIGKTTLVDAFIEQLAPSLPVWPGRGQCAEQYGAGEAYLPLLEAFGRLGREPGGEDVIATLAQYAPTWLAQLPTLLRPGDREALQRTLAGGSHRRRTLLPLMSDYD